MIEALVISGLWYCFDDAMATLTGYEPLGTVPLYAVFLLFWIVMMLRGKPFGEVVRERNIARREARK